MNIAVNKTMRFEAAHRLQNHPGLCSNLHGHSYKVEVCVVIDSAGIDKHTGMVMDFSELKSIIKDEVIQHYDHSVILSFTDPLVQAVQGSCTFQRMITMEGEPTAENMAQSILNDVSSKVSFAVDTLLSIIVRLWETEDSYVVCSRNFQ